MFARMLLISLVTGTTAGCVLPTEPVPSGARQVELADFTTASQVEGSHVIEIPAEVTALPEVEENLAGTDVGNTEVEVEETELVTNVPGVGEEVSELGPMEFDERVKVGVRWPVDGLIGQINGRPVFAAEFFLPIEDRLIQMGQTDTPVNSRNAILSLVRERFSSYVNSELIIAEAESELTPQMQEGIFAWLGSMEEEVTAQRGGTRFAAEQSILEETGLTLEEFLEQQRKLGLAGQLLRKRVEPRTIVSWRDVEQAYRDRIEQFQPPRSVRVGRILLLNKRDADQLEQAKAAFAEGKSFTEVATLIEAKDDGFWRAFTLDSDGIAGIGDIRTDIRTALVDAKEDAPVGPFEGRSSTAWYAILGYITPPSQSIFDPPVQLGLRNGLEGMRYDIEEQKYLTSLRRRWVNDDIRKMELRLFEIALRRYWQP